MNTEEDMGFECNDPECWCRMADEIRKNDDMDRADEARRATKKAERKAKRKKRVVV